MDGRSQGSRRRGSKARRGNKRRGKPTRPLDRKVEKALGFVEPVERFQVSRNLPYTRLHNPHGPYPGAFYTVRKFPDKINAATGIQFTDGSSTAQFRFTQSQTDGSTKAWAMAFQLDDLAAADLNAVAALFDQYRFEKVMVRFVANRPTGQQIPSGATNQVVPSMIVAVDRDDSATVSWSAIHEYDNAIIVSGEEDFECVLEPSVTPSLWASGAFSGYAVVPSSSQWVDIANPSVPAHGVKGVCSSLSAGSSTAWEWAVSLEYIISFKNSR